MKKKTEYDLALEFFIENGITIDNYQLNLLRESFDHHLTSKEKIQIQTNLYKECSSIFNSINTTINKYPIIKKCAKINNKIDISATSVGSTKKGISVSYNNCFSQYLKVYVADKNDIPEAKSEWKSFESDIKQISNDSSNQGIKFKVSSFYPTGVGVINIELKESLIKKLLKNSTEASNTDVYKFVFTKYDKFVKFLNKPSKLSGTAFNSFTIADICKIIGMSSNTLNNIVSKNFKPIGKLYNDSDEKALSNGYYLIENISSSSGEYLVYSVSAKKLYYLNNEHDECYEFYNNFPYDDSDLEDFVYNQKEKKDLLVALKQYDKEKGYNLL